MNTSRSTENPLQRIPAEEIATWNTRFVTRTTWVSMGAGPVPIQRTFAHEDVTTTNGSVFHRECDCLTCVYYNSAGNRRLGVPTWLREPWGTNAPESTSGFPRFR